MRLPTLKQLDKAGISAHHLLYNYIMQLNLDYVNAVDSHSKQLIYKRQERAIKRWNEYFYGQTMSKGV